MSKSSFIIREAQPEEHQALGAIMVDVYSSLEGFPQPDEKPGYYQMLQNVGELTQKESISIFVALSSTDKVLGGVVYMRRLKDYGAPGLVTTIPQASGFRLLAVLPETRGMGVGKALIQKCIDQTKVDGNQQLIIHSTEFMKVAWGMYERMGFSRFPDIDFQQGQLNVYGFKLNID
ncbi:GNAT family N-acetyltransferase [Balneola vulgaris]|uniref:GNAT family N-acetyltransferase n=1 Tax=Balneola vulgaris TaxID=287535 RepID=UPI000368A441|nr:GNAT family N-acetyltransferase [Balneola vulgaris]